MKKKTDQEDPERILKESFGIDLNSIREAEKLARLDFDDSERRLILSSLTKTLEQLDDRRTSILSYELSPAFVCAVSAIQSRKASGREPDEIVRSPAAKAALPEADEDIAFTPVSQLSRWIESGTLTSRRLTEIYISRLKALNPKMNCVVTLMERQALAQADRADGEISTGRYRGPLHGIPWGAKDLLDTAGIRTTWGAMPFRHRVPDKNAVVVDRLNQAGAVLVAKLSLGALAMGDEWFDGQTMNPWNTEEGSSGSSAGSAAATAAGSVGFSIGTETLGSIVSPCLRCGATGLRPTFGRVPRTGAMALSWSFDKIGPICRSVEDTALVLAAIHGRDAGDYDSVDWPLTFDAAGKLNGLRVGIDPEWFEDEKVSDAEKQMLDVLAKQGLIRKIKLPDLPYGALPVILQVEAAAAFEELTLSNRDDELRRQDADAWPNTFRRSRFIPAVEYVQIQRLRRRVMEIMDEVFQRVDLLFAPVETSPLQVITNATGHPSLTLPVGIAKNGRPEGATLYAGLFREDLLCRIGMHLEGEFHFLEHRPALEN